MKILIAEDDPSSRELLERTLIRWGYEVVAASDGVEAWEALQGPDAPRLAVLDWMMPRMDGIEVCRRVRETPETANLYIILLTAKPSKEDMVTGLDAGANDYVTKPFDRAELRARVRVGARMVDLQESLNARIRELEDALAHVKQLQGILPICCYCKKIRGDADFWQQVEAYISSHSAAQFSHAICPDCFETVVRPELEQAVLEHESAS